MNLDRRAFLQLLAAASAAGLALDAPGVLAADSKASEALYDLPPFGNVGLLHFTDCHAQLLPVHYREPSVNIGVAGATGKPPHLVGEALLKAYGIPAGSARAHAFTSLDFAAAAARYGKVGGFAHLATLVKRLRAARPGALLLDGGDTWQGSATALWTQGADMVAACGQLGVDVMTGHWEFTLGADRVKALIEGELKQQRIAFVAQNVKTNDFGDPVFDPFVIREVAGVPVAVIGQAFPYTPIANPRHFVPDWTFGIQDDELQKQVDAARGQGAAVVVVLSHNGMDVDLKMASRVTGVDAILGGHTHDGVPAPVVVANPRGRTLVTNAGSNGKFLGVLDFDVKDGRVRDFRYTLLPVFADLLPADPGMQQTIDAIRAPYRDKLGETLAVTEGLLYRRGNFNGSWDQLILDAIQAVKGAQIAFSPGFRWGTTLLPGQPITREAMMEQLAITYPATTLSDLSGAMIKTILEDVCDNLFHPDPYYQQGGDMVRVGGLSYTCTPGNAAGARISDLRLDGKPLDADKTYKVGGWAPVAAGAGGEPIWEVVEQYLRARPTVAPPRLALPRLVGVDGNPGIAS
ncbi:MAG: thiosulfohydrolase SoxB [Lautropia sp.]